MVLTDTLCRYVYTETQRDPPEVRISKPVYQVGETLKANCTSSPAQPVADIKWFVNGKPVSTVRPGTDSLTFVPPIVSVADNLFKQKWRTTWGGCAALSTDL